MHARSTTVQGDPARIEEAIAHVRDHVMPAVTAIDGCLGLSMLCDRDTGRAIVTTAWESEDAMAASAEQVMPLREEAERLLDASTSEVDAWEVAVVHRDHGAPEGACARVTWLHGEPSAADRAVDMYRMAVVPRLQEFEGFCSASMLINRDAGRAVGTVLFDSRESLEATRDAASQIRARVAQELGATVDDVAEMEVALAHLHVPEMA